MPITTAKNVLQADDAFAITPSDATLIVADAGNTRGYDCCYVHVAGASGNVVVVTKCGTQVTVYGIQGTTIPLLVKQVLSTGKTAGNLVGFVSTQGI
jgi:hypothetical protein